MTNIKILEWNINQRSCEKLFPDYIISEIAQRNPDVIVLVEFKGKENKNRWAHACSEDYFTYSYTGSQYTNKNKVKRGNGIYIALKKSIFNEPYPEEDVAQEEDFKNNQPNWLRIKCKLQTGEELTISGVRIKTGIKSRNRKEELQDRKKQIEWILEKNKNFNNQIIVGDLNYGQSETDWESSLKLNWQDIIYLMRDKGYLDGNQYSPYAPAGSSFRDRTLDWLIIRGISIDYNSKYNKLDWDFGKNNNNLPYLDGYMVPEGYFVISEPSYPDHAILMTEVVV